MEHIIDAPMRNNNA